MPRHVNITIRSTSKIDDDPTHSSNIHDLVYGSTNVIGRDVKVCNAVAGHSSSRNAVSDSPLSAHPGSTLACNSSTKEAEAEQKR